MTAPNGIQTLELIYTALWDIHDDLAMSAHMNDKDAEVVTAKWNSEHEEGDACSLLEMRILRNRARLIRSQAEGVMIAISKLRQVISPHLPVL
tara:strand:- start:98 stop:376 length:279 start_codon:yes stop_codon:yes gene_type:complete